MATSTVGTDFVGQALKSAVNECNQKNENINHEAMLEISDINTLLMHQPLSPWEDETFMKPQSYALERNMKEKATPKSKSKSKSRNTIEKEHVVKKPKLHHPKNVAASNELRALLERKDEVHSQINDRALPSTSMPNAVPEPIMIQDEEDIKLDMFSQDSDITIIKQCIALKKSLTKDKEMVEIELKTKKEEANMLQSQIDGLHHRLNEVKQCVSEIEHRQTVMLNKLKLISEL